MGYGSKKKECSKEENLTRRKYLSNEEEERILSTQPWKMWMICWLRWMQMRSSMSQMRLLLAQETEEISGLAEDESLDLLSPPWRPSWVKTPSGFI